MNEELHNAIEHTHRVTEEADYLPEVRQREHLAGEKASEVIAVLSERHPGLQGEWSFRIGGTVEFARRWNSNEEQYIATFAFLHFESISVDEIAGHIVAWEINNLRVECDRLKKRCLSLAEERDDIIRLVQDEIDDVCVDQASAVRLRKRLKKKEPAFRLRRRNP